MTKKVYVTSNARAAARTLVARDQERGRQTRPAIVKIANARRDETGELAVDPSAPLPNVPST